MIDPVKVRDLTVLAPCLELTLFFNRPLAEVARHLRGPLTQFLDQHKDEFRWCRIDEMKTMKPAAPLLTDALTFLFDTPARWADASVNIYATAGSGPRDAGVPALELDFTNTDPAVGLLRLCLAPLDPEPASATLLELARSVVSVATPFWGYAGYGLFTNTTDAVVRREGLRAAGRMLPRYAGLTFADPFDFRRPAAHGLLDMSWLTIVGPALMERGELGEPAAADVTIETAATGTRIVRAGARPSIGDRNRGEVLSDYQAAAQVVASLRAPDEVMADVIVEGLPEDLEPAWKDRHFG